MSSLDDPPRLPADDSQLAHAYRDASRAEMLSQRSSSSKTFAMIGCRESYVLRVSVLAGLLVLNVVLYWASVDVLTPKEVEKRALLPAAILSETAFTVLLTLATG